MTEFGQNCDEAITITITTSSLHGQPLIFLMERAYQEQGRNYVVMGYSDGILLEILTELVKNPRHNLENSSSS